MSVSQYQQQSFLRRHSLGWSALVMSITAEIKPFNRQFPVVQYLTNRFHVAVRLFSNRSQMTSKCGKNCPSVSVMFLPHFDVHLWSITEQTHGNMEIFLFLYDKKNENTRKKCPFISNFASLTDTKIALTWSYVYKKWSELIGCYA